MTLEKWARMVIEWAEKASLNEARQNDFADNLGGKRINRAWEVTLRKIAEQGRVALEKKA